MSAPRSPGTDLVAPSEFGPFDALTDAAHALYIEGRSEQAIEVCRQWRRLTEAAGDIISTRYLRYIEAIALQERGRQREAVLVATELVAGLGDAPEPVWRAKGLAVVAESSVRLHQHGRAVAAVAEADWLVGDIPADTYGHLSASMAVALAMRSLNLYEPADKLLRALGGQVDLTLEVYVVQEMALLSAYWATALHLIGHDADAAPQFATAVQRALRMQRAALRVGNEVMLARGEVIEAYGIAALGDTRLAAARAAAACERFDLRPELAETHLAHLVLGRAAAADHRFSEARAHLRSVVEDANAAGRETWASAATEALAELAVDELGDHDAVPLWRQLARTAMTQLWEEREGRFAALQDRRKIRQLADETNRMGLAVLQDPLTGLGNRRLLRTSLETATTVPGVVFVDVDDFKAVNDEFSHAVGDEVLREIATVLRAHCRHDDVLVRYGGDEFVILTSGDLASAESVARRINEAIRASDWGRLAPGLLVTVSVGIGHPSLGVTDPFTAADTALLAAKRAGRDTVVLADAARPDLTAATSH
ncbi:GGDEF domain-containing protein [Actinotalea subterranea]|uniref:GGDEF domain-containing protein n=1 Tax=Actinotalea subterranea TaxID=2607497 RepID=UPI0011EE13C2|nr:GGDEF domain-containing protein [Actinotalea subterranea]